MEMYSPFPQTPFQQIKSDNNTSGIHHLTQQFYRTITIVTTHQFLCSLSCNRNSLYNTNHILPEEFQDNVFGFPTGFLSNHSSIHEAERCNTQLLTNVPNCPGPYLRLFPARLVRPASTHHLQVTNPKANRLYNKVIAFGQPNYLGAKEIINPDFPIEVWETQLEAYHDQQVITFMKYGWPTAFMGKSIPKLNLENHASSIQSLAVEKFLQKEVSLGGIMGPFVVPPFDWVRTNPLMAHSKKDSDQQPIILDFKFSGRRISEQCHTQGNF